jgi:hypothetical protein
MELADPTTTREITQATWRAVKEIAERYDIIFAHLKAEILAARKIGNELRAQGKDAACKGNLLSFFCDVYDCPGGHFLKHLMPLFVLCLAASG